MKAITSRKGMASLRFLSAEDFLLENYMDSNAKYLRISFTLVPTKPVEVERIKALLENELTSLCPGGYIRAEGVVLGEVKELKASIYPVQLMNLDGTPYGGGD